MTNRIIARWATTLAATVALATAGIAAGTAGASADVPSNGHYCAVRDGAAVRTKPDGTARDNLAKGQTFQVESHAGEHYVYGYKIVNGVHGWVLNDSLAPC